MKKTIVILFICLVFSAYGYAETQKDGFDVTTLFSAVKSFNINDSRIAPFKKYIEANLHESSSSSSSDEVTENEQWVFQDAKGNSVQIDTEKNMKTGAGTVKITIIGTEDFVSPLRARLR